MIRDLEELSEADRHAALSVMWCGGVGETPCDVLDTLACKVPPSTDAPGISGAHARYRHALLKERQRRETL